MNGIVAGYSDERFGPNDTITREQMATILYRYAQYKVYDTTDKANLSKYTDTAQVGSYAVEAHPLGQRGGFGQRHQRHHADPQGQCHTGAGRSYAHAVWPEVCRKVKTEVCRKDRRIAPVLPVSLCSSRALR